MRYLFAFPNEGMRETLSIPISFIRSKEEHYKIFREFSKLILIPKVPIKKEEEN